MLSGGNILVKALREHGVDRVFCVAGESYLDALDALLNFPDIDVVTCRHESGATFMAESYANLTGKPGVAFVTRGPGACNASIGVHTGKQSSTPMLLFVGLVGTEDEGKEAFQEFDLPQMFGSHSKWAAVIGQTSDIAGYVSHGFHIAQSERGGPVVLGLPEDVLSGSVDAGVTELASVVQAAVDELSLKAVTQALEEAENPLVIVGGGGWSDALCESFEDWALKAGVPVAASFRRQDLFDHTHACYVGELGTGPNPALVQYVKRADMICVIGARITEIVTQEYTLFEDGQKLVHVYPSAHEFGKAYAPELAVKAGIGSFVRALGDVALKHVEKRQAWLEEGRQAYIEWTAIQDGSQGWDGADMTQVFRHLREHLPEDAVITTDAGNFSGWCQRYLRYGRPGRLLAPISGAMGYAVPAAVGASITCPGRVVVGFCGDGGFMMSGQELATAVHHGARPIIVVCNNNMFGTIRMHQEKHYPGRISGTALTNPDFVKLAESYGVFAARVEHADDFPDVWETALRSEKPVLIEIKQDPRQITTQSKL